MADRHRQDLAFGVIQLGEAPAPNGRRDHHPLRRVGKALRESLGSDDIAGRWNDSQMVVGYYGCTGAEAVRRLDAVLTFLTDSDETLLAAIAGGVSEFPKNGQDAGALHAAAVSAMDSALVANGRRIVCAG